MVRELPLICSRRGLRNKDQAVLVLVSMPLLLTLCGPSLGAEQE